MIPLSFAWKEACWGRAVVFGWRPSVRAPAVAVAMFETMRQAQDFARRIGRKAIIRRCHLSGLWIVSVPVPPTPAWLPLSRFNAPEAFRVMLAGAC